jgi:hypothetical protein
LSALKSAESLSGCFVRAADSASSSTLVRHRRNALKPPWSRAL